MSELLHRPATELADLVRQGEVTARELVEESLAQIESLDGEVNAFTLVDAEGALAAASEVNSDDDRPFAGVPIAIKDLGPNTAGLRTTWGSDVFGEFTPEHDSNCVERLRNAGFIIVGKTNAPEIGILPTTEPRRFGPTRNPWNLAHTPGGSSGGSAAAVAAEMVPIAHGNDGGGSIRIPAACCGLVGLKTSRNRISQAPEVAQSMLVTEGVLTRTVEDTARTLDLLAGYVTGDANWAPPESAPFAQLAQRDPGKLRIGVIRQPPVDTTVDPLNLAGVDQTVALLEGLGHEVELIELQLGELDLVEPFIKMWAVGVGLGASFGALVGGKVPDAQTLEPLTLKLFEIGQSIGAVEYQQTEIFLLALARMMIVQFSQFDAVLTPSLAQRPVPIGTINGMLEPDPLEGFHLAAKFAPFAAVGNLTGLPGISLPIATGDDGLPTGIQLIGKPAGEAQLLALSTQIEAAAPWRDRRATLARTENAAS